MTADSALSSSSVNPARRASRIDYMRVSNPALDLYRLLRLAVPSICKVSQGL
jgi:hypothetical protein